MDRQVGGQRAEAGLVAEALPDAGDDDVGRGDRAVLGARGAQRGADLLGGDRRAVEDDLSPSGTAARSTAAAAAIPASAAFCARRMPASSAADLARRRAAKVSWSGVSTTPSARSRSATASGKAGSTIAWRSPIRATARETSSSMI